MSAGADTHKECTVSGIWDTYVVDDIPESCSAGLSNGGNDFLFPTPDTKPSDSKVLDLVIVRL